MTGSYPEKQVYPKNLETVNIDRLRVRGRQVLKTEAGKAKED